jgi:hypothetical protein
MEKMRDKLIAEGHIAPPEVFTPLSRFIEGILILGLILSQSRSVQTSIDLDPPWEIYYDNWIHEGTCALPRWGASTPHLERDSIINGVYKPRNLRSPPSSEYVCTGTTSLTALLMIPQRLCEVDTDQSLPLPVRRGHSFSHANPFASLKIEEGEEQMMTRPPPVDVVVLRDLLKTPISK